MTLPSSGPLSLSQIQGEFGGNNPISLSEYYRGGSLVPNSSFNNEIPTSGVVAVSNYRGARNATVISYQIIGAGGGGGYGLEDGGGSGRASSGAASTMTGTGVSINAAGGLGGTNGSINQGDVPPRTGQASIYGPGGAGVGNGAAGNSAPSTSYGAGGGGAGGDSPSTYDSSGNAGQGGFAGQYLTGTLTLVYGTVLSINIGGGGAGGTGGVYNGGSGANGFCSLSFDGKTVNFTSTTSFTIT